MFKPSRNILREKWTESLKSVLPIALIVFVIGVPLVLTAFVFGIGSMTAIFG